jgi:hypothetical protein
LEGAVATRFQVTFDCADPARQTRFSATALRYKIEDPTRGFDTWNAYWRSIGVPDEELDDAHDAADSIVDPEGVQPRIWFQIVPEGKLDEPRTDAGLP